MTIHWYLTKKFIRSLLIVLTIFICLGYIQELATGTVASIGGEGSFSGKKLLLVFLFVPQFIFENLPMVFLLSALHFCIFLLRSREYLAIVTFGKKGQNVTRLAMALSFVLGVLCLTLLNPLVAWTNIESQQLLTADNEIKKVEINQDRFWFQVKIAENDAIIRAARLDTNQENKIHLDDVEILVKNTEVSPVANYCKASEIHIHNLYLEIFPEEQCDLGAELFRGMDTGENALSVLIQTDITPEDFVALIPLEQTNIWTSLKISKTLEKLGLLASAHEQNVYFFSLIALPFLIAFMVGIGVGILPFFELNGLYVGAFLIFLFGLGIFFMDKILYSFVLNQNFPSLIASLLFPVPILMAFCVFAGIATFPNFQLPKFDLKFMTCTVIFAAIFLFNFIVNYFVIRQFLTSEFAILNFSLISSLLLFVMMPYFEKQGKNVFNLKFLP
ncbi:MAG: LptF/LptG family permease [Rhodobacteraceae bacterium]|nr:LptF/LptG family permease [Paracoccaceae bacterium]